MTSMQLHISSTLDTAHIILQAFKGMLITYVYLCIKSVPVFYTKTTALN